jgi:hypothetical protein
MRDADDRPVMVKRSWTSIAILGLLLAHGACAPADQKSPVQNGANGKSEQRDVGEFHSTPSKRVYARDLPEDDARARSWGRYGKSFREENYMLVTWEEAQRILTTADLEGGKEYPNGWFIIGTKQGERFATLPPRAIDFWDFSRQHNVDLTHFAPE